MSSMTITLITSYLVIHIIPTVAIDKLILASRKTATCRFILIPNFAHSNHNKKPLQKTPKELHYGQVNGARSHIQLLALHWPASNSTTATNSAVVVVVMLVVAPVAAD